jgi:lysophospholipase L1-like esterase
VARSRSAAATCGAALLLAAGSHALLRGFGLALAAVVAREPGWARALALVVALAGLGAALSGVALLRGAGVRRGAGLSAAVAAAYLVTAFLVARPAPVPPGLGGLLLPQRGPWEEGYPGRPQVTYRVSGQGFRGPVFDLAPQPGVRRIVLIGDSFVFGSGVPEEGTLSSSLARALARRPGQPAEVLNLGVIGSNLASHVDLLEAVVRHLSPDAVVLCLTLPNDLSRWDVQVARREALRPGLFALARLLLGDEGAQVAWDLALLERQTTPEGLAHLRRQLERVARLRQEAGARVTFFVYGAGGPGLGEAVGAIPGADLVAPAHRVADFIPGDGHPTAEGNDAFAALLAERLQRP